MLERYLKERKKEKRKLFIAGGEGALYESGESNKKDDCGAGKGCGGVGVGCGGERISAFFFETIVVLYK
ncbi:hypothetical protein C5S32_09805 [ANME-1 cluster archaeon GoMg1]|nr:hypothetical protein [ANME-1 cluster archaeon GoMg1]